MSRRLADGPDLRVWLTDGPVADYSYVSIRCARFAVSFAAAELT
jgi:hypothetical protein